MKKIFLLIPLLLMMIARVSAQQQTMRAPDGFDVVQPGIAHGKIDSLTYTSATVGTSRKVLVYTPP